MKVSLIILSPVKEQNLRMETHRKKKNTCGTICLKYLLFLFNVCFWLAGGAVLAVGVWTLVDKSDYVSLLNSSFYSASAFILIVAGVIVTLTGIIGCCATLNEKRSLLIVYLVLLLCVFLLEITAGVLAYVYQQQLDDELRQNLKLNMQQKYLQPGQESVTLSVDKLQQEFKCCGSHNFSDWSDSEWIRREGTQQLVPDSCCKTPSNLCGRRDHPSNIYREEGGCVEKLEDYIRSQLYILGGVGVGIAFLQLIGMMFTCCLCRNLKEDLY
ncbi:CD151 antigen isoform X2 [Poecilia reticulata]|nr:PREDICTED: CD151 antigen-like isoform X2 [Poecilia reticulata]